MAAYLQPFESVSFTPPRGRLGHSVPTPRPLGGPPQRIDENRQFFQLAAAAAGVQSTTALPPGPNLASPAQFYCHRDHTVGGASSKLDRIRTHHDLPYMESFTEVQEGGSGGEGGDEADETDSGRPQSRNSVSHGNPHRMNVTLDRFMGDSLLHFSYSTAAGSMGVPPLDSQLGGSFVTAFSQGQGLNTSLNAPFLHQNISSPSGESSYLFPTAARNPNKAIVTIDAQSSLILVANEMTCELFGYQRNELMGMKIQNLFAEPYWAKQRALVEQNIDASGETVLVSGKVMDAMTSYGLLFPVSVWMKRVSSAVQPRVIVVIEPVERSSAHFTMDKKGVVVSSEPWFACIFGRTASSEVVGRSVLEFIPSLLLPTTTEELAELPPKQALTGRTKDGTAFPLTVTFTDISQNLSIGDLYSPTEDTTASQEELNAGATVQRPNSSSSTHSQPASGQPAGGKPLGGGNINVTSISKGEIPVDFKSIGDTDTSVHKRCFDEGESPRSPARVEEEVPGGRGHHYYINAKVTVYAVLSGMISFLPDGTIHGCNHHFALMLLGYSQQELLKKDITFLIPEFYNHINFVDDHGMPLPPLDEEEGSEDDDMFPTVAERSLSPDQAFETLRTATGQAKPQIHASPTRKMGPAVLRSPLKRAALGAKLSSHTTHSHNSRVGGFTTRPHSAPEFPSKASVGADQQLPATMDATTTWNSELRLSTLPEELTPTDGDDCSGGEGSRNDMSDGVTPSSSQVMNKGTMSSWVMETQSSKTMREGSCLDGEGALVHGEYEVGMWREGAVPRDGLLGDTLKELVTVSTEVDPGTDLRQVDSTLAASADSNETSSAQELLDPTAIVRPISSLSEPAGRVVMECTTLIDSPSVDQLIELLNRERNEKDQGSPRTLAQLGEKQLFSSTPTTRSTESLQQSENQRSDGAALVGVAGSSEGGVRGMDECSVASISSLPEGIFLGEARHKDGSLLAIIFQLKCITLADGKPLFCLWLSRDMDCERARNADLNMSMNRQPADPYRTDQLFSPDVGLPMDPISPHAPHPRLQQEEYVAMEGEYSIHYDTLKPIGKGAFGFVRQAERKDDGTMVVVKFLRKASVLKDCWVLDNEMGEVPLEISLLAKLAHPNIVQLLEAYENEHYFQMVMEKHGDGLDLFEFIEKNPRLNEPLMSYMFRQIVAGLAYLHEQNILHRDIKDENIILDHQFHLKLIDFGSAAYMEPGKLFNTFCGTLEYCSPEVLLGNSYSGPELEMWALGVTLYTLVFGENPFFEVEETISGHLQPPYLTSPALMKIIFWLLHPDPRSRATLKDLLKDKWVNQPVDMTQYSFDLVMGYTHPTAQNGVTEKVSSVDSEKLDSSARKLQLEEQLQVSDSSLHDE